MYTRIHTCTRTDTRRYLLPVLTLLALYSGHLMPRSISMIDMIDIFKSQLAAKFTTDNECRADFLGISPPT